MAIKIDRDVKLNLYESCIDYNSINAILNEEQLKEIEIIKNSITKTFLIKDCYCRINNITGSKLKLEFKLYIYTNDRKKLIDTKIFSFTPSVEENSQNFIKQGYEYLKTLEEYKDAIDILEPAQSA